MPNLRLSLEARLQNAGTVFHLGILEVQQIQRRVHLLLVTQICPTSTVPAALVLLPKIHGAQYDVKKGSTLGISKYSAPFARSLFVCSIGVHSCSKDYVRVVTDSKAAHQHQTNEDHDHVENGRP